jgi:hypothetical protein
MNATTAQANGFAARSGATGQGSGNGEVEGYDPYMSAAGPFFGGGETVMFWSDLTYANGLNLNLVEGSFQAASFTTLAILPLTGTQLNLYLPAAKIGRGAYVYALENLGTVINQNDIFNYYGVVGIQSIGNGTPHGTLNCFPVLSVAEAYSIDKKTDDA